MAGDSSVNDREYVMMRRRLEGLVIGETMQVGKAVICRSANLHYHIRLPTGTHVDVRARGSSVRLLDEVLTFTMGGE